MLCLLVEDFKDTSPEILEDDGKGGVICIVGESLEPSGELTLLCCDLNGKEWTVCNSTEDAVWEYYHDGALKALRLLNDAEFSKAIKWRNRLQKQLEYFKDCASVHSVLKKKFLQVENLLTKFAEWYSRFLLDMPVPRELTEPEKQESPPKKTRRYDAKALAELCAKYMEESGKASPSQYELEAETGVSQESWSRYLKKEEFRSHLKWLLEERMKEIGDNHEFFVHARKIVNKQLEGREKSKERDFEKYGRTGKTVRAKEALLKGTDGSEIEEDIDDGLLKKMSIGEIIKEILLLQPKMDPEELQNSTREDLIELFKTIRS